MDPKIIDKVVQTFYQGGFDDVSNSLECTYPDGLDTEVFASQLWSWKEARLTSEREHVTPYIFKHPELFRLGLVKHEEDLSALRWTVDTPRDLEFMRTIYDFIQDEECGMDEILKLLRDIRKLQN